MRDGKCDFLKFVEKFLCWWTTPKLFFITQKIAKEEWMQVEKFEKNMYVARDN